MVEDLPARRALVWVVGEHLLDQVFRFFRYEVPDPRLERELASFYFGHHFLAAGPVERRCTGEDHVHQDAAGPDVALFVVAAVDDLGRDIEHRAGLLLELGVFLEAHRNAEVDELDGGVDVVVQE